MKIAEVENKYIDYIRNHDLCYKYGIYDKIVDIELDDNTYFEIRKLFYNSERLQQEYPDEFDMDIYIDTIIVDFECALENHRKFVENPEYDIEPWMDEETMDQLELVEKNKVSVTIVNGDGTTDEKFIDSRLLDGTLWS